MSMLEIAEAARGIRTKYPRAAAELATWRTALQSMKECGPAVLLRPSIAAQYDDIRCNCRLALQTCQRWSMEVCRLAHQVATKMPELSASLRYVGSTEDWHEQAGIDWGAVENELRTIEAAALAAAREKAVVESENLVEAERSSSRQKRIEEERVGSDENIEISDPPPEMVLKLRGLSRELLMYMWKRGPVTRDELRPLWKKQPSDKAVENAINYLNEKLSQLHLKTTTVERNGGMYYLKHPQK